MLIRSILAGIAMFLMIQGLFDVLGIARSIPSIGAMASGLLFSINYWSIEKIVFGGRNKNGKN